MHKMETKTSTSTKITDVLLLPPSCIAQHFGGNSIHVSVQASCMQGKGFLRLTCSHAGCWGMRGGGAAKQCLRYWPKMHASPGGSTSWISTPQRFPVSEAKGYAGLTRISTGAPPLSTRLPVPAAERLGPHVEAKQQLELSCGLASPATNVAAPDDASATAACTSFRDAPYAPSAGWRPPESKAGDRPSVIYTVGFPSSPFRAKFNTTGSPVGVDSTAAEEAANSSGPHGSRYLHRHTGPINKAPPLAPEATERFTSIINSVIVKESNVDYNGTEQDGKKRTGTEKS